MIQIKCCLKDLLQYFFNVIYIIFQQLMDSTAIISALETYFRDRTTQLTEVIKFYPITKYTNDDGKSTTDITNKYFVMYNSPVPDQKERIEEK